MHRTKNMIFHQNHPVIILLGKSRQDEEENYRMIILFILGLPQACLKYLGSCGGVPPPDPLYAGLRHNIG